ncbi:hypothetical protein [uncultured Azohydromonas sp.]|uniref:hypothetical protein n=1 Tax=uncultured Azohydromonas sp. TaxID=487342 RepID=UPI00262E32FD|nr:hypothetical protein [uncultured Azohydromonas sp.]
MTRWPGFQPGLALCAALVFCFTAPPARAADRPYLVLSTAAMEDDEQSWSLGGRLIRTGADNALQFGLEYGFTRATSVELEWTVERAGGGEHAREAELEFKQLFNDSERDGWGAGLSVTLGLTRERLEGDEGATEPGEPPGRRARRGLTVQLPLSVPLWQEQGLAHVNLGWQREPSGGGQGFLAAGLERRLAGRTWGFGEAVWQPGKRLLHAGIRHWLRRDRLALDLSVQRQQDDGRWRNGVVIGVVAYDL